MDDGSINATKMCKMVVNEFHDWTRLKPSKELDYKHLRKINWKWS